MGFALTITGSHRVKSRTVRKQNWTPAKECVGSPLPTVGPPMMNPLRLVAVAFVLLLSRWPAAGDVPDQLRFSIPAPPVGVQTDAQLGNSVAMDGALTVLGAPYDDSGGNDSGVVKVFDTTTGALLFVLLNPGPERAFGHFGIAVAISGTRVVVGAYGDGTGNRDPGVAYVYDLSGATPTVPVAILDNPDGAAENSFGYSVAISGVRVAVGAYGDDPGGVERGRVHLYDLAGATPTAPVATLIDPGVAADNGFGYSVAISDARVVVGAFRDDVGESDAGSAYVYDLSGATPTEPIATFNNPGAAGNDWFGFSVAISGTRVIVGTPYDDTGADDTGSAYVYDLSGVTPTEPVATLSNPEAAASDFFGFSVAILGTQTVVAAFSNDMGGLDAGSVYVYELGSATPTVPIATINNPEPAEYDWFGYSVAISGTQVIVGAPNDDTEAGDSGSAYVYDLSGAVPTTPLHALHDAGPATSDFFGNSVAISGMRLAVGVYGDDTGAGDAGSVYVYDLSGALPMVPVAVLNNPDPAVDDRFGWKVALDGARLVVAAYRNAAVGNDSGSVYIYDLSGATPTVPAVTLDNPDPAVSFWFGYSVAISGTRVVVGAFDNDLGLGGVGSAYVYDLSGATPTTPTVTLRNPGPGAEDFFGNAVAISGTWVVVGAYSDDTGALDSGSVYVYDLNGVMPTNPVVTLHNPDPEESDYFGFAVNISGTRVAVGALGDDTGGVDAGSAYVYDVSGLTPTLPVVTLRNPNPEPLDYFGRSVAIFRERLVVGATGDETSATSTGRAYVYELNGPTPSVPVATLDNPDPQLGDAFGFSVATDGFSVAIGAPLDDSPQADKGSAYVFMSDTCLIIPAGTSANTTGGTFDCIVIGAGGTLTLGEPPIAPAPVAGATAPPSTAVAAVLSSPIPVTETVPFVERRGTYEGLIHSRKPGQASRGVARFTVDGGGRFTGFIRSEGRSYKLRGEAVLETTGKPSSQGAGEFSRALLRLRPSGAARFVGRLRDGTPISAGCWRLKPDARSVARSTRLSLVPRSKAAARQVELRETAHINPR